MFVDKIIKILWNQYNYSDNIIMVSCFQDLKPRKDKLQILNVQGLKTQLKQNKKMHGGFTDIK